MVNELGNGVKKFITPDRIILIAILVFQIGKFVSSTSISTTDLQAQVKANTTAISSHADYADTHYVHDDVFNQVEKRLEQEISDKLDNLQQLILEQKKQP